MGEHLLTGGIEPSEVVAQHSVDERLTARGLQQRPQIVIHPDDALIDQAIEVNGLLRRAGLQRGLTYGTRFRYRVTRLRDRLHRWRTRKAPGGAGRRGGSWS